MNDAGQPALNIYQRINEVRKVVKYVKKDAQVSGRYKAVTHDAVTAWARQPLIDHGVIVVPALVWSRVADTGTATKSGAPILRFEARYDVVFVNADEPSDQIVFPAAAHALDEGDKAPGKAVSYATKYALLKLLSIETGEDEESRIQAGGIEPDPEGKRILEACENYQQFKAKWNSLDKEKRKTLLGVKDAMVAKFKEAHRGQEVNNGTAD